MRYPRDYNTVPRALFWLLHLVWLFPWSAFLPAAAAAQLQARGPRGTNAPAGVVLDGLHSAVLHLLDHAGVLLDALLSGAGAAHRVGRGGGRRVDSRRPAGDLGGRGAGGGGHRDSAVPGVEHAGAGRHFRGADAESGALHAVAGAHDRPHAAVLRVSEDCRWPWRVSPSWSGALGVWRLQGTRALRGGWR